MESRREATIFSLICKLLDEECVAPLQKFKPTLVTVALEVEAVAVCWWPYNYWDCEVGMQTGQVISFGISLSTVTSAAGRGCFQ